MDSNSGSLWGGSYGAPDVQSGSTSPLTNSRPPSPLPPSRMNGGSEKRSSWSAKASSAVNGYSSKRFWGKHLRKLSTQLPSYSPWTSASGSGSTAHRSSPLHTARMFVLRRPKASTFLLLCGILLFTLVSPFLRHGFRSSRHLGGGHKIVLILAANKGGGVMEWKNGNQWASERESIANKKHYANKWGYHLEIKDMSTKKRYAHEWRESWEKVDIIKQTMRQYPKAEWFWWLDLHTYIMEPSISLQSHIFNHLTKVTYRDINIYNPLNITHPLTKETHPYLTDVERSAIGDGSPESINLIVPQDCGGFNLGSFFIRRSEWSERLLDIWWDPVGYEQKHMDWEHKEQDALEYLYTSQPWIRTSTAFIPQRMINSFPPGACAETPNDPRIFYNEKDRDFLVNMAGCEWGRDCWGEMSTYKRLSKKLNRTLWERWFGKK
ncbi:galactosyl transferase GMA12/MNN10 family-domain-containing protein [Tirmania nivea]|nr:galactosyl transferase GMA12/MNN10 family-domain-containing protein [Tirmania nivea]